MGTGTRKINLKGLKKNELICTYGYIKNKLQDKG